MKTLFRLAWHKRGAPLARAFKLPGAYPLYCEYLLRIRRYAQADSEGGPPGGGRLWLFDRGPNAKVLSSELAAQHLRREIDAGGGALEFVVGPADGFSEAEIARFKPRLRWSLGPMTLPHELAAVVAAEQVYRAFSILHNAPYHLGH